MHTINIVLFLCTQVISPDGTLLHGVLPYHRAEIYVHTKQILDSGCEYYKLNTKCQKIVDGQDDKFVTTYLCSVGDND